MFRSSKPIPGLCRILTPLALATLATLAQAQVLITSDKSDELTSQETCTLTATHPDGKARNWTWRVVGFPEPSGFLEALGDHQVRFKVPETFVATAYAVVAQAQDDPNLSGTLVLRTKPKQFSGVAFHVEETFDDYRVPSLRSFPGKLDPAGGVLRHLAFCADPTMGNLDRCWITASQFALQAFKITGDPVPLPAEVSKSGDWTYLVVATLPPGPGTPPPGAPRVVFNRLKCRGHYLLREVVALDPNGRLRVLAKHHSARFSDPNRSPTPLAKLKGIYDLALDREGNTYVLGESSILKIDLKGQSSQLWEWHWQKDLPPFRRYSLQAMALDPLTGDLYVYSRHFLGQVTAKGELIPLIGGDPSTTSEAVNEAGEVLDLPLGWIPKATGFQFLYGYMAIRGRELILSGEKGLDVFHLDTRRLVRLLPRFAGVGEPFKLGPVHYLNPHLAASQCASLSQPRGGFALTPEATCLVTGAQEPMAACTRFAELELPGDEPLTSVMDFKSGAAQLETKAEAAAGAMASKAGGPALGPGDSLWLDPDQVSVTVAANGEGGVYQRRRIKTNQRFLGQCRLKPGSLGQGRAQVNLQFVDSQGMVLGYGQGVDAGMPHEVQAPVREQTLLQVVGSAPEGTDRVVFYLQVRGGAPGEVVTFEDVIFHQAP